MIYTIPIYMDFKNHTDESSANPDKLSVANPSAHSLLIF